MQLGYLHAIADRVSARDSMIFMGANTVFTCTNRVFIDANRVLTGVSRVLTCPKRVVWYFFICVFILFGFQSRFFFPVNIFFPVMAFVRFTIFPVSHREKKFPAGKIIFTGKNRFSRREKFSR